MALKLAHAYVCSLAHSRPTFADAEAVFNRIECRRELFGNDGSIGELGDRLAEALTADAAHFERRLVEAAP